MGVFHSKEVEPEHTKRDVSSEPECAPGLTLYSTTCHGPPVSTIAACVDSYPTPDICDGFMFNFAAATTTQTSTKTSSAHTKTTSSTSTPSKNPRSSSTLPTTSTQTSLISSSSQIFQVASSNQTSSTTSSIELFSVTSFISDVMAAPVAATSLAPAATAQRSPSPHSRTAAVAAGTVGAIVGVIAALILALLVLRWRKRRTEDELKATQHDNDLQSQKLDGNGAGSVSQDKHASESAPAYRDADHNSLLYPGINRAGHGGSAAYSRSDAYSPESSFSHIQPSPEMPGSMPNPIGRQPELEVPAFHIPAELSLDTERSSINTPRKTPNPSRVNSSGQGGLGQTADGSVMHPNLAMTGGEARGNGAGRPGNNHVMSWMSYDGDGSSPIQ